MALILSSSAFRLQIRWRMAPLSKRPVFGRVRQERLSSLFWKWQQNFARLTPPRPSSLWVIAILFTIWVIRGLPKRPKRPAWTARLSSTSRPKKTVNSAKRLKITTSHLSAWQRRRQMQSASQKSSMARRALFIMCQ